MTPHPTPKRPSQITDQAATSAWSMYRAIVGIGVLCALVIVGVYHATAERIGNNQQAFLDAAIAEVLPAATSTIAVTADQNGHLDRTPETLDLPVFYGYDMENKLAGAVITAQGMGYQDTIRVLYAYSFELSAITGFKVLDSKETPGLGDRIEKEPHFIANFTRLDARLRADGKALLHDIAVVKQGEKSAAWEIDGITGATITSEAIGKILNDSAALWVPVLEQNAASFSHYIVTEEF